MDPRSDLATAVITAATAAGWVLGVAAMAVPATTSLTAARVIVPLAPVAAIGALLAGAPAGAGATFLATALAAGAVVGSGELGRAFVQASAYGDEERCPLRPPLGFALAAGLAWVLWAAVMLAGIVLTSVGTWWLGVPLVAIGVSASVPLARRWHLLTRRWLVLVPAGLVVHDPVMLSETVMLRRTQVEGLRLAPADTEALDLTGPTSGHAVEVIARQPVTVVLSPDRRRPTGRAVHARSILISPSRPGAALVAARRRRLPVG